LPAGILTVAGVGAPEGAVTGTLYLVGTPIGNMEDITLRALRVLGAVDLVAAEDTRATRSLLARHGLRRPLLSYGQHNEARRSAAILAALAGGDVALVSEAGMPAISDPGYRLVAAAVAAGFPVVPIPGPSAVLAALAASGLPSDRFHYLGFLPRRPGERRRRLAEVAALPSTLVLFEAPHRLREALADIRAVLGERPIAVARELTKLHEEVFRGTVGQAITHFAAPRGEFTLVIGGAPAARPEADLDPARVAALRREGLPDREIAARLVRETGRPRREIYRELLELGTD
jgi:16S rRNA (cytidine1402-2'-O)-methyltransferase